MRHKRAHKQYKTSFSTGKWLKWKRQKTKSKSDEVTKLLNEMLAAFEIMPPEEYCDLCDRGEKDMAGFEYDYRMYTE
jgi:hypothetical protein